MGTAIFHVDAFTVSPFAGNPAAVCILDRPWPADFMQSIAREMNLSETAFVTQGKEGYDLRWFTPTVEVDLCGHATLASAHVLWSQGYIPREDTISFHTRSGELPASRRGDWIEMDFPSVPPVPAEGSVELVKALGVMPTYVGKSRFDYLVELDGEEYVRKLRPDFRLLMELPVRGVIVTSLASDANYQFVSRFFAPGSGINEDPVTGSAHCTLGPFWAPRLDRNELMGYQASERGGFVKVRLSGERVYLSGQAVTISRGELTLDCSDY